MASISVVAASSARLAELRAALPDNVEIDYLRTADFTYSTPNDIVILDIDLGQAGDLQAAKAWLSNRAPHGKVAVCVDDAGSHLQLTQAHALGATAVLPRPLQAAPLRRLLFGPDRPPRTVETAPPRAIDDASPDLNAIEDLFTAARAGQSPCIDALTRTGGQIVGRLRTVGLSSYLTAIRGHHSRTYAHCLSITAVAASFGMHLGFGQNDTERLAVAGLLHDIGKSQIPLEILEKTSALDADERMIMRSHPLLGYEMLRNTPGLPEDTADMVLHHHEYLDGSGYPHGLQGSQISDLNRMMTIADVYGALIEPRSYKPPMTGPQALDVLHAMGPKLDGALVRAFAPLARRAA